MDYTQIKRRIVNPGERCFYSHVYAIYNEFGVIAFVNADCAQDALNEAADSGHLDCQLMDMIDFREYESNGWDDSYMLLGNASEPFWSEYLGITQIK